MRRSLPLLAALAAAPSLLWAQSSVHGQVPAAAAGGGSAMPSASDPRPVAEAAARTGPVAIDGRLDDAAWQKAKPVGGFLQQQPDEGKAPTERTELRFLYDANALYVGARMYDSHGAAGVKSLLARRDQLMNGNAPSDKIAIVLDPF